MKVKNVNLKYNVILYDWNKRDIRNYNVLSCLDLKEINKKILKKEILNRDEFKEYLKGKFMYYYWSKAEYEILVGDLTGREDTFKKIDVYSQIEMNLDLITDYIIQEMKIEFK